MGVGESFEVLDHDFSMSSLTPSVIFRITIPLAPDMSWYNGTVHVGLKDSVFQPSSPARHTAEMEHVSLCLPFAFIFVFEIEQKEGLVAKQFSSKSTVNRKTLNRYLWVPS